MGRRPEVAMRSNLQDTEETRDEEARGQEPHPSPEETVLKQLNWEIHWLSIILEVMDLKQHMLALLNKLKDAHEQLQGLLPGLERS